MQGIRAAPRSRKGARILGIVSSARVLPGVPPELLVYDRPSRCPYLRDRIARMPLRLPARPLARDELDVRLSRGDRRQGYVLYRTDCPTCSACIPLRLSVNQVRLSRTQKRVAARTAQVCTVELGPPEVDEERVRLYNRHKALRHLEDEQPPINDESYRDFLVHTCCETFEMRYRIGDRLVGVAVVDRGACSLSSVYCFYDPELSKLSLGTFSILKQLELCRTWGLEYLYLGLYIEECRPMRYKARFAAHERLVAGSWVPFEKVELAAAP